MEQLDSPRRHDVDWLRVFATYLLIVFHVAMVFNPAPFYHVRNHEVSFAMLVLCGFISLWHMPLFFVLAGWSLVASLRARGAAGLLRERAVKLAVPLLAGCTLLMPPIKYLELRGGLDLSAHGLRVSSELQESFRSVIPSGLGVAPPFHESFLEFLPTFFTRLDRFTWGHLWFLAYLLTFTVLYLPLFARLLRTRPLAAAPRAWWVYAPIAPLAAIQLVLRPHWPGIQNLYDDWANFAYYTTFLAAGFVVARHPALERAVHRERRRALAIAAGATVVLLLAVLRVVAAPAVLLAGSAVASWCFVVALLGFAHQRWTRSGPVLAYLSESAFPVYILHQLAIVTIGYWLVRLPLGIPAKFTLLLAASVVATLSVYHLLVRRFRVLRFLFGMKPKLRAIVRPASARRVAAAGFAVMTMLAWRAVGSAASPIGLWYAERGAAQVRIERCDDGLCGRVVWLRSPFDDAGCELRDTRNPDPRLRGRGIVGLEILRGLTESAVERETWSDGTIYALTTGWTYRCLARTDGDDVLRLRGYVGIRLLGRTTTWRRVGSERRSCQAAAAPSEGGRP